MDKKDSFSMSKYKILVMYNSFKYNFDFKYSLRQTPVIRKHLTTLIIYKGTVILRTI